MRTLNIMVLGLICAGLGRQEVVAVTSDNPYVGSITNRNLFSLKAPSRPEEALPPSTPAGLPSVKLAGITTIMGGKRAILRVTRPARPPQPASEVSLMLLEGGPTEEGVKILEINIAAGSVKIDNQGNIQTLDLANDAPKSAPSPAGGGALPVPGQNPAGAIPVPRPMPTPGASAAGGVPSISRPVRGTSAPSAPGTSAPQSGGVLGAGPSGLPTQSAVSTPQAQLSPEEQMVMMELQREQMKDRISAGTFPPLPPTPLTPVLQQEQQNETARP